MLTGRSEFLDSHCFGEAFESSLTLGSIDLIFGHRAEILPLLFGWRVVLVILRCNFDPFNFERHPELRFNPLKRLLLEFN